MSEPPAENAEAAAATTEAATGTRPVVASLQQRRPAPRWLRIVARIAEGGLIAIAFGALLVWCSIPDTSQLADENPTSTAFIDLRRAQAADAGRTLEVKWQWRPLSKISRYLRAAVIYAEDYNFYRHDGIDWAAVEHAVEANLERGTFALGGSTITQQLAKNLYLSPSKSLVRKLREMLIAQSLEDDLSKQRILELYLNVVEWGDGVFGAEAAARHWFKHSAQSLTPAEAIRLAIALPNPITRAPNVRSPELTKKAVRITHLLRMQGLIDESQERATLDALGAPNEGTLSSKRPELPLPPVAPPAETPMAPPAETPVAPPAQPPTEPPAPPTPAPTEAIDAALPVEEPSEPAPPAPPGE
jgi:monofunctional biosynthetic peptidoglycan transglycosylase